MACFIGPAAEAVVTTALTKVVKTQEKKADVEKEGIAFSDKLKWLNHMLWGGSGLLAFEHLWHGELTPFFPFLTNAANSADAHAMLHEIATSGVGMAALVTLVWTGMVLVTGRQKEKSHNPAAAVTERVEK